MLPEEHLKEALEHLKKASRDQEVRGVEYGYIQSAHHSARQAYSKVTDRREGLDDCEVLTDDGGGQV
jgi:pyridoxal/pyridoxine/pyridoxamine kinase